MALVISEHRGLLTAATGGVLLVSLVLGGGTRGGLLSDVFLQLACLPLLALLLLRTGNGDATEPDVRPARSTPIVPVLIAVGVLLVPLLQIVPLPPEVWTRLPGRAAVVSGITGLGESLPWRGISVTPHLTWLSLLSVLPPVAIFIATLELGASARRRIATLLMAFGVLSLFLGLAQIAQGPSSPLRFFAYTSNDVAVAFFANRNHFASLLYVSTLLAAAWIASASGRVVLASSAEDVNERAKPYLALLAALLVLVALLVAQISTSSRAGLILTMVALVGVYLVTLASPGAKLVSRYGRLTLAVAGLTAVLVGQLALWRLLDRFGIDPLADARLAFARQTWKAALEHMPFGSGVGSFVPIYALAERREDLMIDTYANHAHNDVLQVMLEAGLPGVVLLIAALAWIGFASFRLWRDPPSGLSTFDLALARAAGLALLLIAAHSLADYPLRTGAMMAVAAFLAALLVPPPDEAPVRQRPQLRSVRHSRPGHHRAGESHHQLPVRGLTTDPESATPRPASGRGGSWPEQWGGGTSPSPDAVPGVPGGGNAPER